MDYDERVPKLLAQQVALPRLARRRGWSVLHSLANLAPVAARVPLVVTLHDVLPLRERTMSYVSRTSIGLVIRLTAPRACVVVTIAGATRDDILSTLRLDQRRVVVVHNGPGRSVGRAAKPQALARRLGLTGRRVVLNVAAKRAHKNQRLLLEAAPRLPEDVVVLLVGHDDGDGPFLRARAQELGIAERVIQLDYVPDKELEALYALAACVAL